MSKPLTQVFAGDLGITGVQHGLGTVHAIKNLENVVADLYMTHCDFLVLGSVAEGSLLMFF
jgi:hypothetical protein